jgi:rhodanese-related sulfurtransferase
MSKGVTTGAKERESREQKVGPDSTMSEVLNAYPWAHRALFTKYHIGGCSSCSFQMDETIKDLCARNNALDVSEVLSFLSQSHRKDLEMMMAPGDLSNLLKEEKSEESLKVVDVRSRGEWEATHIEGSIFLSQDSMQEILAHWPRENKLVIVDHVGKQALDAAAFFGGHGFTEVKCLEGGIDAWSQKVDSSIRRYRMA